MTLSNFFAKTLRAELANTRWSWGALDIDGLRLFLRVWKDDIYRGSTGEKVIIRRKIPTTKSPGYGERKKQIALIDKGVPAFGVVCIAAGPRTIGARNIAEFDATQVLQFGEITEDEDFVYAEILAHVPIEQLANAPTVDDRLTADLTAIVKDKSTASTTKKALIDARVGQGAFRTAVLNLWENHCAITGSSTFAAIRASHIQPWRASTNNERLDAQNGLPLGASLDALFDRGLITFAASGRLLVSSSLSTRERTIFGLNRASLIKSPSLKTADYLAYHRTRLFRK